MLRNQSVLSSACGTRLRMLKAYSAATLATILLQLSCVEVGPFRSSAYGRDSSCHGVDGRDAARRLGRRAQAAPLRRWEQIWRGEGRGRAPDSARKTPPDLHCCRPAGSPSPHRFSSSPPHERALRSLPPAPATGVFCFLFQLCAGT